MNSLWSLQVIGYIISIISVGLYTLYYHLLSQTLSYAIARSCGAVLKYILMPSIIPPICRVLITWLHNSTIGKYLGLDRRIGDHKLISIVCSLIALIHMIAHISNNPATLFTQPGITGMIMLSSMALPLAGVFIIRHYSLYMQHFSYSAQILRPHQLGAFIFIIMYGFHVSPPRLIYYSIGIYGTYLLDRLLEYYYYTYATRIRWARRIYGTSYIMLNIKKPLKFGISQAGQYAMISLPFIDGLLECYHPFTIISDTEDSLIFLIQKLGPWTQRLANLIDESQTAHKLKVNIIGPFGWTMSKFYDDDKITCIGTGIGITPFCSFLNGSYNRKEVIPFLDMHFTQKTLAEFIPCMASICSVCKNTLPRLSVHFYVTVMTDWPTIHDWCKSNSEDTIRYVLDDDIEEFDGLTVKIHIGRPNFKNIIENSSVVAVCGNPIVTHMVKKIANSYGKKCYMETF